MTALLLDEMLSGAIAEQLRAALVGTPDEELLAHALAQDRLLVTANVAGFGAIRHRLARRRSRARRPRLRDQPGLPAEPVVLGAIVSSLLAPHHSGTLPRPGTETFLWQA